MLAFIAACGGSTGPKLPVAVGTYALTSVSGASSAYPYQAKFNDGTTFTVVADTLVISGQQWITESAAEVEFSRQMIRSPGQPAVSYSGTALLSTSGDIEFQDPGATNFALGSGELAVPALTAITITGVALTFTKVR